MKLEFYFGNILKKKKSKTIYRLCAHGSMVVSQWDLEFEDQECTIRPDLCMMPFIF